MGPASEELLIDLRGSLGPKGPAGQHTGATAMSRLGAYRNKPFGLHSPA